MFFGEPIECPRSKYTSERVVDFLQGGMDDKVINSATLEGYSFNYQWEENTSHWGNTALNETTGLYRGGFSTIPVPFYGTNVERQLVLRADYSLYNLRSSAVLDYEIEIGDGTSFLYIVPSTTSVTAEAGASVDTLYRDTLLRSKMGTAAAIDHTTPLAIRFNYAAHYNRCLCLTVSVDIAQGRVAMYCDGQIKGWLPVEGLDALRSTYFSIRFSHETSSARSMWFSQFRQKFWL